MGIVLVNEKIIELRTREEYKVFVSYPRASCSWILKQIEKDIKNLSALPLTDLLLSERDKNLSPKEAVDIVDTELAVLLELADEYWMVFSPSVKLCLPELTEERFVCGSLERPYIWMELGFIRFSDIKKNTQRSIYYLLHGITSDEFEELTQHRLPPNKTMSFSLDSSESYNELLKGLKNRVTKHNKNLELANKL